MYIVFEARVYGGSNVQGEVSMRRTAGRSRSGRRLQRGQTTTEYLMVISVLVIALVYVSYEVFFNPNGPVAQGLNSLLATSGDSDVNIPAQVNRGYISANP